MTSTPFVSVILACRCEAQHIQSTLDSILAQEEPGRGFEIVVADGMSDDGTREILADATRVHPNIRVIDNPVRFTAAGLNAAVRAAAGEVLVRMDAHTHYASDYLRQCVTVLKSTGADNVGGPWIAWADTYVGGAIAAAFQSPFAAGGARSHVPNYEGEVDSVYLGCWRREVFQRFGGFDEGLIRNQDDEHNLRILRGGGRIWQSPKIRCWYHARSSLHDLFRQYLQYGYWKVLVIRKHGKPASLRHLVPGTFVLTAGLLLLISALCAAIRPFCSATTWLGSIVTSLFPPVLTSLILLSLAYLAALLLASIHTAWQTRWKFLPVLPVVFGCFHIGYGVGFLKGVLDHAILGSASSAMSRLTREGKPRSGTSSKGELIKPADHVSAHESPEQTPSL